MEVLKGAAKHLNRTAVAANASHHSYGDILSRSQGLASTISRLVEGSGAGPNAGPRIAIMAKPGRQFVEGTWAAWLAQSIAVPLCLSHPAEEIRYVLKDAQASLLLTTRDLEPHLAPVARATGVALHVMDDSPTPDADQAKDARGQLHEQLGGLTQDHGALIVYTSGTTGRPKGALHSHGNLAAHIHALVTSWEWRETDRILHALPLHHVHGIINALHCAHAAGAAVEFLPSFSPAAVWARLMREEDPVTVYMGVPTMYAYLLSHYDKMSTTEQEQARAAAGRLRLTVSGSAACPLPIMQCWHALSGQWLLERYGMTETNMILSNPYRGERRPGAVGLPLPGVEVRAVPSSSGAQYARQGNEGEIRVRGPGVFQGYWNRPETTAEAFDEEGWFRTGDTGVLDGDPPYWRILGRTSVDIIKSGGYKISTPAIEDVLLAHTRIREAAVLGLPDQALGEAVAAVVACEGGEVTLEDVRAWCAERLPPYQIPSVLKVVDAIPRNAMGKVNKKQLRSSLFPVEEN